MMIAYFIIIVLLLIISGFLSGTESAFTTLNTLRLKRHNSEKTTKTKTLTIKIKENFEYYLISILIGNNAVNLLLSNILTIIVIGTLGEQYSFVSTIISVTLLLIIGEITPKLLGAKFSEKWSVGSSQIIRALSIILFILSHPLFLLLKKVNKDAEKDSVTQEELEAAIDTVENDGIIDSDKSELLQNALTFDEVCAYEVCTPRIDVKGLDIESDSQEWINMTVSSEFSRLAVYEGTLDKPLGTIRVKEYLRWLIDNRDLNEEQHKEGLIKQITPPVFVHHTMKIDDVYKLMNKNKNHIAFVSDEWGGTQGIVTMDDALERLVGDIWDEDDNKEDGFEMHDDGSFSFNGTMTIEELFLALDKNVDTDEFESITVGGLAVELLNAFPSENDTFECNGISFVVDEVAGRRVKRLTGRFIGEEPLV